jgi:hypothetical protein
MNQIDNIMDFVAKNFNATRWGATDALRAAIEKAIASGEGALQALAVQPEQALLEAYQKLEGVAGLALEVMVKHRQMKGDAPMGAPSKK